MFCTSDWCRLLIESVVWIPSVKETNRLAAKSSDLQSGGVLPCESPLSGQKLPKENNVCRTDYDIQTILSLRAVCPKTEKQTRADHESGECVCG